MRKIRYFVILSVAAALLLAAFSCKKNDDTSTKSYLSGSLRFRDYVPQYVDKDEIIVFSPYGITHPDGKALGMYYFISSLMTSNDTVYYANPQEGQLGPLPEDYEDVYVPVQFGAIQDTIGTFTISFVIYPIDKDVYYNSSAYTSVIVVDDDESIPQIDADWFLFNGYDKYTDARDGNKYVEVPLAGNTWLHRNLAFDGYDRSLGTAYYGYEVLGYLYGRYYTWEEATAACPDGWKLPSNKDWDDLGVGKSDGYSLSTLLSPAEFNSEEMWEYWPKVGVITNTSRLSIIPAGYGNKAAMTFEGLGKFAAFWTSDTLEGNDKQAIYRYICDTDPDLKTGTADKTSMALSVRCVKIK